jgi:hypothetical protein
MTVTVYEITRRNFPEDNNLYSHFHDNLSFRFLFLLVDDLTAIYGMIV